MLSSGKEKNCWLRIAAIIHVDIMPTAPSTLGLSLIFRIRNIKDYAEDLFIPKKWL